MHDPQVASKTILYLMEKPALNDCAFFARWLGLAAQLMRNYYPKDL